MCLQQMILLKVKSEYVTSGIKTSQVAFLLIQTKSLLPEMHDLISVAPFLPTLLVTPSPSILFKIQTLPHSTLRPLLCFIFLQSTIPLTKVPVKAGPADDLCQYLAQSKHCKYNC